MNAAGYALLREFEGLRLRPYRDAAGIATIGYGHTLGVTMQTPPIARERAEQWLREDVARAEAVVRAHARVPLNANQSAALASFAFNVGPGRPGYKDGFAWLRSGRPSTLLTLLNQGQYEAAAQQLGHWVYAGGKKLAGLERRRAAERALFNTPAGEG